MEFKYSKFSVDLPRSSIKNFNKFPREELITFSGVIPAFSSFLMTLTNFKMGRAPGPPDKRCSLYSSSKSESSSVASPFAHRPLASSPF